MTATISVASPAYANTTDGLVLAVDVNCAGGGSATVVITAVQINPSLTTGAATALDFCTCGGSDNVASVFVPATVGGPWAATSVSFTAVALNALGEQIAMASGSVPVVAS